LIRARISSALSAIAITAILSGCGISSPRARVTKQQQLRRIHSQLGLDPPFRLQGVGGLDDGGTGFVTILGADSETLTVFADNRSGRPGQLPVEGFSTGKEFDRNVWLHHYPEEAGSQKLEFGSVAESAVVDLLHLQIQELFSAREESALVRAEQRSRHPKKGDPDYHWNVWWNSLSPRERAVYDLRNVLHRIEFRRREALNRKTDSAR
jgi:hypothetical protein